MSEPKPAGAVVSILFVCAGNTCRSVMAEALARRRFGRAARAESAGLRPQPAEDARAAIDTLRSLFGLDASGHVPRAVASVDLDAFDLVVAMDRGVAGSLPVVGDGKLIVWDIDDPWDEPSGYPACARAIDAAVSRLQEHLRKPA